MSPPDAPDPVDPTDPSHADGGRTWARRELLRRAATSTLTMQACGPPTALMLVLIAPDLPMRTRIAFVVVETLIVAVSCALIGALILRLRRGDARIDGLDRAATCWLFFTGLPWAALPWLCRDASYTTMVLSLLVALGAFTLVTVATVADRRWFHVVNLPVAISLVVVVGTGEAQVPRIMAFLAFGFALVQGISHRQINDVVREAVFGTEEQARLRRELEATNEELRHRATHDPLTGLANRDLFEQALHAAMQRSRSGRRQLAVVFVDLDRFKVVNDSLGHAVGDELLVQVTERMRGRVRDSDLLARIGGDEFTVLVPDLVSGDEAVAVARRVQEAFEDPFTVAGREMVMGASIGLALGDGDDAAGDLLRFADSALYDAKRAGRGRVEVFDRSATTRVSGQLDAETRLRQAIESGEMEAWYQPIVDVHTGRIVSMEALARWRHPERGVLLPGAFMPLVEEAGLTAVLGRRIATQAVDFRRSLLGLVPDDVPIYVNVVADRSSLAKVVDTMRSLIDRAALPRTAMGIEITERAVIGDVGVAAAALSRARAEGLSVALDDFGTGFSPLLLIRDLPLDVVKIDRSFVIGLLHNPADEAVVVSVIELAKRLGARITVEGVEEMAQLRRLTDLGADYVQGFLFSKAVPPQELAARLRQSTVWTPAVPSLPR